MYRADRGFRAVGCLPGLAATPALSAEAIAQASCADSPAQRAQAALKEPQQTKLVMLGTAAGPVPGRTRRMTSHVMLSNGGLYA
jgi:hypothetical protein